MTREEFEKLVKDSEYRIPGYPYDYFYAIYARRIQEETKPEDWKYFYGKVETTKELAEKIEQEDSRALKTLANERHAIYTEMYDLLLKEFGNDLADVKIIYGNFYHAES